MTDRSPIDNILPRLDNVRTRGEGNYIACCPAHRDRSPSLSIKQADDGRVLLHCFAGCSAGDVTAAIGLELSDLFPPRDDYRPTPRRQRWNPQAVFETIEREARIVSIAASDIAAGKTLSTADADRVATAASRINDAIQQTGLNKR
jgi:hypothetical protein